MTRILLKNKKNVHFYQTEIKSSETVAEKSKEQAWRKVQKCLFRA